jgi:hypothetical protein
LIFPSQVAKHDIAYSKAAKKIDVKRLKRVMWKKLKEEERPDTQPSPVSIHFAAME